MLSPDMCGSWNCSRDADGTSGERRDRTVRAQPMGPYPSRSPDSSMIVYLNQIFGGGAVDERVSVVSLIGGLAQSLT
jgi:hypothetical protein